MFYINSYTGVHCGAKPTNVLPFMSVFLRDFGFLLPCSTRVSLWPPATPTPPPNPFPGHLHRAPPTFNPTTPLPPLTSTSCHAHPSARGNPPTLHPARLSSLIRSVTKHRQRHSGEAVGYACLAPSPPSHATTNGYYSSLRCYQMSWRPKNAITGHQNTPNRHTTTLPTIPYSFGVGGAKTHI